MSSVAFLCGIPQEAAGPESGVEIPNLMTSAARLLPILPAINAPAPKSAAQVGEGSAFIFAPPCLRVDFSVRRLRGARTIKMRNAPVKPSKLPVVSQFDCNSLLTQTVASHVPILCV